MSGTTHHVRWQDGAMWLGYFEEFPDYWTQGESVSELEVDLRDLYRDISDFGWVGAGLTPAKGE